MEEKLMEMRFTFLSFLFSSNPNSQESFNNLKSKKYYKDFFKLMFKGNKLNA